MSGWARLSRCGAHDIVILRPLQQMIALAHAYLYRTCEFYRTAHWMRFAKVNQISLPINEHIVAMLHASRMMDSRYSGVTGTGILTTGRVTLTTWSWGDIDVAMSVLSSYHTCIRNGQIHVLDPLRILR